MKNKTLALIRQKTLRTHQKPNVKHPHSPDQNIPIPNNLLGQFSATPLKLGHLSHYDAFSLTFNPQKLSHEGPQMMESATNLKDSQQLCELEKQNYRLIQSNYNLLARHAAIMEFVRRSLLQTIMMIDQSHYVNAVKCIYELLDRMRSIQPSSQVGGSNVPPPARLHERTSSAVEEYLIMDSNSPKQHNKCRHQNLQIISNNLQYVFFPEPKSQFLQLHEQGRFIHINESMQNPHSYPQILTPHFKPKHRNHKHAYSLQQSFYFNPRSNVSQPADNNMVRTLHNMQKQECQSELNGGNKYTKLQIDEFVVRNMESEKSKRSVSYDKNNKKSSEQKMEELYRMLLMQATVIDKVYHNRQ